MAINNLTAGIGASALGSQRLGLESAAKSPLNGVGGEKSFADVLRAVAKPVTDAQHAADVEVDKLLSGEAEDLHSLQIAMEKSAISFQFLLQVRNKVVDAYREVMNMQV